MAHLVTALSDRGSIAFDEKVRTLSITEDTSVVLEGSS